MIRTPAADMISITTMHGAILVVFLKMKMKKRKRKKEKEEHTAPEHTVAAASKADSIDL